jgi:phenylalanyl-tRNA synthetase alpha chain
MRGVCGMLPRLMWDRIKELEQEAAEALERVRDSQTLEKFKSAYLGARGKLKEAMAWLKEASKEEKPRLGQSLNALKQRIEGEFERLRTELGSGQQAAGGPVLDVTEPGLPPVLGRVHPIQQVLDELIEVFARMGFEVAEGPEIEDERHNFVALNIPPEHPARDPNDNFYLDDTHLLRTQTSTIQIRVMEHRRPPLRIVAPGRVYRPDTHDATHSSMFHQIEGLYVDRGVTFADLKTTLIQFAHAMFGPQAEVRLRPSYFPFTEPSAEMDIKMQVRGRMQWVELGGCGMVDPAVFEAVGYDPQEWTGFAFGLGVERVVMKRYGIADIRWLFENDVRFLRQF